MTRTDGVRAPKKGPLACALGTIALLLSALPVTAQMVSPAIDLPDQPFSYPSQPTDEIGVAYAPSATEITPEGYLYTGFGELMFFAGPGLTPVNQRIRTLAEGDLPIVTYTVKHDAVEYRFEIFAAALGAAQPDGPVVDFVRVTAVNTGATPQLASLAAAVRYNGPQDTQSGSGDNRYRRPVAPTEPGEYQQPGVEFSKDWVYGFDHDALVRDGKVLYEFPSAPEPQLALTWETDYSKLPQLQPHRLDVREQTPTGAATYHVLLQPGASHAFDFRMPLLPVAPGDPLVAQMRNADYAAYRSAVAAYWHGRLAHGMSLSVPEPKVVETFNASLVYDLMALNRIGSQDVQTVNQTHYHSFYLRDSADIVRMYDETGYPEEAGHVLDFELTKQQPDGNFMSQPGQYDGWGQTLWILGAHYRFTHDRAYAELVYPHMYRALDWFEKATAADPMHIMPATDVRDNEYVPGHLTGYNFLALDGLQNLDYLAGVLGKTSDAARIQTDEATFRRNFDIALDRATAKTGGYIPPDLDENGLGTDWGNLLSLTPRPQLKLTDPRVTDTLKVVRGKYQEGITTYTQPDEGQFLHHYLIIKNTLTETILGDQQWAVGELYAELMHTTSTQAGWEYAVRPWSDRNFRGNLSPHGWFAADFRSMLRSMLVRETDTDLHLLSVLSPEWLGAGKQVRAERVPTFFGTVSVALAMPTATSAMLTLDTHYTTPPQHVVLHLPWFYTVSAAQADGHSLAVTQDGLGHPVLLLPVNTHRVALTWTRHADTPAMSYAKTVADYKQEYADRYARWLATGESYDWHPHHTDAAEGSATH